MTDRTVGVKLRLDADGKALVAEVKRVEAATAGISQAGKGAASGLNETAEAVQRTGKAAKEAESAAKGLAREQKEAEAAARALAREQKQAEAAARAQAREQKEAAAAARALAREQEAQAAAAERAADRARKAAESAARAQAREQKDAAAAARALAREQAAQAAAAERAAERARKAAEAAAQAQAREHRQAEAAARAHAREQAAAANAAERAAEKLRKEAESAAEAARQNSLAGQAANLLQGALTSLGATLTGGAVLSFALGVARAGDAMTALARQAELVSGSADGFRQIFTAAQAAGLRVDVLTQAVNNFTSALGKQGRTYQETIQFTTDLAASLRLYGVAGEDVREITRQLGQALNSGQLNGEELVILGERGGALYALFERTVQEILGTQDTLKTLGSEGKLSAEVVTRAWDTLFKLLRPQIDDLGETMDQATSRMRNSWQALMAELDRAMQASAWYRYLTGGIAESLDYWRDLMAGRDAGAAAAAVGGLAEADVPAALQAVTDRLGALRAQINEVEQQIATHGERGIVGRVLGANLPELQSQLARLRAELTQQERVREGLIQQTVRGRAAERDAAAAERERVETGRAQAAVTSALTDAQAAYAARAAEVLRLNQAQRATLVEILPVVDQMAQRYGVAREVILSLIKQESGFNRMARSTAGAFGLMQLMPGTARDVASSLGLASNAAQDWAGNIELGTAYLKQQIREFGSLDKALAAYNAGPGAVRRAGGIPGFAETQQYVPAVLENLRKLAPLAGSGADALLALADGEGAAAREADRLATALLSAADALTAGEADAAGYLDALREQGELARLSGAEQARMRVSIELTNRARAAEARAVEAARKGNTALSDVMLAVSRRYRDVIPQAQALAAANVEGGKALDALGRETETFAELALGAAKSAADAIQRSLGDGLYGLFTGGLESAQDFVAGLKDVLLRGVAEIAAQLLTQRVVVPIVGALVGTGGSAAVASVAGAGGSVAGAGTSGGGFGLGGLGSLFTGSGMGLSAGRMLAGTAGNLGLSGNWIGSSVANLATTPNWAFGVGGIGGSLLGSTLSQGQYASTGSSLGSMGGSLLGGALFGGPIGAIAGGLLGGLGGGFLGSLFGDDARKQRNRQIAEMERQQAEANARGHAEAVANSEAMIAAYQQRRAAVNLGLAAFGAAPAGSWFQYSDSGADSLRRDAVNNLSAVAAVGRSGRASYYQGRALHWIGGAGSAEDALAAAADLWAMFDQVGATLRMFGSEVSRLGPLAEESAESILSMSGGLDALRRAQETYRAAYWTEAEQRAFSTEQMTRALGELGVSTVPRTREEFRRLVEAQDLATEGGQRVYVGLLGLSGAFAALHDDAGRAADEVARLKDQLQQWVDRMMATNPLSITQSLADARAAYQVQLSAARAGDTDALGGITAYAERLIGAAMAAAGSGLDAERIRRRTLADVRGLAGYADGGIAVGPASGYPVLLHGTEAVIPLANGAVPVALDFGGLLAELSALRAEVRAGNDRIGGHTARTAAVLEELQDDGVVIRS